MKKTSLLVAVLTLLMAPLGAAGQGVAISHGSGYYPSPFMLTMEPDGVATASGLTIHYTLDGNEPTGNSTAYEEPLFLSHQCLSTAEIYKIQNCPDSLWRPVDKVERIAVVRAALFDADGVRRSKVNTRAFVIAGLIGRTIDLPVVSLCVGHDDLFDYDSGIFVPGRHFDPEHPRYSGNYSQKGIEWERHCSMVFMTPEGDVYSQDCGMRMHGTSTRAKMQKGLALYARNDYGSKRFNHPFFGEDGAANFKRLSLRPWLASWSGAGVEDWMCQQMAAGLRCDALRTRPVVLFLNGEYWGIYFLEEKPDEHYIADHYGVDDDDVDLLSFWGNEVENGNPDGWRSLYRWLEEADLSRQEDYDWLATRIDIDALMDYMLLEVFITNVDWPANNVRFWSANGSPWRWIFFDGDAALDLWRENSTILGFLTCDDPAQSYPSSPHSTLLFRRLLENHDFRLRSIDRFYKLLYGSWNYAGSAAMLQTIRGMLAGEVEHQSARFGSPKSVTDWKKRMNNIDKYLDTRTKSMVKDYAKHIGVDIGDIDAVLYPNPSVGSAVLRYDCEYGGRIMGSIYDMRGNRVARIDCNANMGRTEVAMPVLPKGVYFVKFDNSGRTVKWIVM